MSRHQIEALDNDRYEAVVGWDRPMGTFFGQVFDRETEEPIYLCGWEIRDTVGTVHELARRLAPWAQLTTKMGETLAAEAEAEPASSFKRAPELQAWLDALTKEV